MKIEQGTIIADRYEVQSQIGSGGFGTVFLATDLQLERRVALKIMKGLDSKEDFERFRREAKALAAIAHPHISTVFSYGFFNEEIPYMVMEYLDGQTLQVFLRDNRPEPTFIANLLRQVCEGLDCAHQGGIIHRDLSPANIFLCKTHSALQVKIIDFGLSKLYVNDAGKTITKTGTILGNPRYMCPEIPNGKRVDARSDIYSLGCIIYECLTGNPPFDADSPVGLIYKQQHVYPETPQFEKADEIADKLTAITLRCIQKLPDKRFQSCQEILEALNKEQSVSVKGLDRWHSSSTSSRKISMHRGFLISASLLLLIGVVAMVTFTGRSRRSLELESQLEKLGKNEPLITSQPARNTGFNSQMQNPTIPNTKIDKQTPAEKKDAIPLLKPVATDAPEKQTLQYIRSYKTDPSQLNKMRMALRVYNGGLYNSGFDLMTSCLKSKMVQDPQDPGLSVKLALCCAAFQAERHELKNARIYLKKCIELRRGIYCPGVDEWILFTAIDAHDSQAIKSLLHECDDGQLLIVLSKRLLNAELCSEALYAAEKAGSIGFKRGDSELMLMARIQTAACFLNLNKKVAAAKLLKERVPPMDFSRPEVIDASLLRAALLALSGEMKTAKEALEQIFIPEQMGVQKIDVKNLLADNSPQAIQALRDMAANSSDPKLTTQALCILALKAPEGQLGTFAAIAMKDCEKSTTASIQEKDLAQFQFANCFQCGLLALRRSLIAELIANIEKNGFTKDELFNIDQQFLTNAKTCQLRLLPSSSDVQESEQLIDEILRTASGRQFKLIMDHQIKNNQLKQAPKVIMFIDNSDVAADISTYLWLHRQNALAFKALERAYSLVGKEPKAGEDLTQGFTRVKLNTIEAMFLIDQNQKTKAKDILNQALTQLKKLPKSRGHLQVYYKLAVALELADMPKNSTTVENYADRLSRN